MDPINAEGTIVTFQSPRNGFPLIAGGVLEPISSLAYIVDAKQYVALSKNAYTINEFFAIVQGYCDLLADLSLVIKMGRNVKMCTINLCNIPEDTVIPDFTSIAWSYDSQGPVKGSIAVEVMCRDLENNHLICYQVPNDLRANAPLHIKTILTPRKYLGVPNNAQLNATDGKEKILKKLNQRIGLIASKTDSFQEAKIEHNLLVCQTATFSPLCISMSLKECAVIDRHLLKAYQYCLNFMPHDAKHSIFLSEKLRGLGLCSFTREYVGALLWDIEVYISNNISLPAHALITSIEEATKQKLWNLSRDNKIPEKLAISNRIQQYQVSGKKTLICHNTFEKPDEELVTFDHTHTMG
jgi:hypothetical protein